MAIAPQVNSQKGRSNDLFGNSLIVAGWGAALTVLFGFLIFQAGTVMGVGGGFNPHVILFIRLPPLALCLFALPISHRFGAPETARVGLIRCASGLAVPRLIIILSSAASDTNRGLTLSLYTFTLFVGASLASPVATVLAPFGPYCFTVSALC